jgi:hypothetical protein
MTLPATVICPVRATLDALGTTTSSTTPAPLPLALDVTMIQSAELVTV